MLKTFFTLHLTSRNNFHMISFPNAKINLGLSVVEKRQDNYHNIETVFLPTGLKDILEVVHNEGGEKPYEWSSTGIVIDTPPENNICIKALELLKADFNIGSVKIHLHKVIPFGAGLGGGSADAAAMLVLLNEMFELRLSQKQLKRYAVQIGADCPFFIDNTPQFATGIGDVLTPIDIDLTGYYLAILVPDVHVSTPDAYRFVKPVEPEFKISDVIKLPVHEWRGKLINDFEESVFKQYPEINKLKEYLYDAGAEYASMSGSGSSVFGLFAKKTELNIDNCFVWTEEIK